ncbi:hypothetical protein ElyMa_000857400 [Elysia marginata]|uniref:Uncharacterized protein n=1 Tax=Elysia marginata TaxID=1093978 RepID=A0AAV4H5S5_9GAST|nr:hypothetical protein ElyMa_000857400 [Elysia marginata]
MAVEGSGLSENVFFQSPRVRFGEPTVSSAQSSLLTFADMVLSFDRKAVLQNIKSTSESNLSFDSNQDESRVFDHTYASCRSSRTTRSRTAKLGNLSNLENLSSARSRSAEKVNSNRSNSDTDSDFEMELDLDISSQLCEKSHIKQEEGEAGTWRSQFQGLSQTPPEPFSAHNYCVKTKRCSSEENISLETLQPTARNSNCYRWSRTQTKLDKHSRKSCSSEDVDKKPRIKSCKSSESVQNECVSKTLHRFVNNTLEFPCWPRKADHTYATATWDGTAASHSLFEEGRCSHSATLVIKSEDCPMEEFDSCTSSPAQVQQSQFPHPTIIQQKEDHTYVKHAYSTDKELPFTTASAAKFDVLEKFSSSKTSSASVDSYTTWPHRFSSATFPRLKSREDHTYFHSGLSGNSSNTRGGREWLSAQTVASAELSQDMQIEETYRSLHSFSQSASAKKDHNYSTSA